MALKRWEKPCHSSRMEVIIFKCCSLIHRLSSRQVNPSCSSGDLISGVFSLGGLKQPTVLTASGTDENHTATLHFCHNVRIFLAFPLGLVEILTCFSIHALHTNELSMNQQIFCWQAIYILYWNDKYKLEH